MFSHRPKPRQCAGSDSLSSRGAGWTKKQPSPPIVEISSNRRAIPNHHESARKP
nr:MAG TPA: hypothetical protein [Caudoviricetes sp.]